MISILIPCYDYNAYPLVSKLEKQALILNINFEIICIDDGSFSPKNEKNQKINLLTNSRFIESKKNLWRIKNRILLDSSNYNNMSKMNKNTTLPHESLLSACKSSPETQNFIVNDDGNFIHFVTEFCYLGSIIDFLLDGMSNIKNRLIKANKAIGVLSLV